MRQNNTATLHRGRDARTALMRSLAVSLVEHGSITTTAGRARMLRPFAERLIRFAKRNTLADRRILVARLGSDKAARKLIAEVAPRYTDRNGGYTRSVSLPRRQGDSAEMTIIQFV